MCARWMMDVGHHLMEDPTYGFAKRTWDLRPARLPSADVRLDVVLGGDEFAIADEGDGAAEPDTGEAAVVEEAAPLGPPGIGEQVESLEETPLGMRIEVSRSAGGVGAGPASIGGASTVPPLDRAPGVAALVRVTDDGGEVSVADARLAAAGIVAEAALGVMEIIERVAAEGTDEGLARAGHGVLGMHSLEEEACGAVLGVGLVPLLLDDGTEHVGIPTVERMAEMPATGDVHAQEGRDEEGADVAGEVGAAQRGDGLGETVQEIEEGREGALHSTEATLNGGLLGRRALALRRVLDGERVVGILGGLSDEGLALVGDKLEAFATGGGLGDDADDEVGGLALVDGEGVEEAALAVADVLGADEFEVDTEDAHVGGVAAELRVRRGDFQVEAAGGAVVVFGWARLLGWRRSGARRTDSPRAQRALGEGNRVAEFSGGDAVLGVEPIEGADDLILHSTSAHRHPADREEPRGDGEEVTFRRPPS